MYYLVSSPTFGCVIKLKLRDLHASHTVYARRVDLSVLVFSLSSV
jgi:hypothetical protein